MFNRLKKTLSIALILVVATFGVVYAADEVLKRDENREPVMGAVTNDASEEIRMLRVDPTTNALIVSTSAVAPTSTVYTSDRKVVAAAGTPEAISASTSTFITCDFQAEESNTGDLVIGGSAIDETPATRKGILLTPSATWTTNVPGDLDAIFIDSEISGDGINYTCQS